MRSGFRGRLITESFARDLLPSLPGAASAPPGCCRLLDAWCHRWEAALGPASSVRAIADAAAVPLLDILGLAGTAREDTPAECRLRIVAAGRPVATLLVVGWNQPLSHVWRAAVLRAVAGDVRWCFCCNGATLRIVDARRTWSRDYLEFDLALLARDDATRSLLWTLVRAESMLATPPLLDRAVDLSARHGLEICRALGSGVVEALQLLVEGLSSRARAPRPSRPLFEHSLTVLYRVLFLLFAEARGLVPMWHPVYRDHYSLEAIVTALLSGRPCRGLWQAIQAISRLAHAGCAAGELKVTAFNGRLFSPSRTAAFETARLGDRVMSRAVIAVSTAPATRDERAPARAQTTPGAVSKRFRIVYRDLDVEQLGSVYEQVLEYEPAPDATAARLTRTRDRRKASGTFYTPRAVTAFLVRRTLEPLVRGRSADDILTLRVLDPAMGSGAFLVAACRYLAAAAEEALVRDGRWHAGDVSALDRVAVRRDIASRCLFGVDLNPTAVQLARLSLWLASLAADKPLSFLDHHLVAGDSLVGATPADLARQPSRLRGRAGRQAPLPLFNEDLLSGTLAEAVRLRLQLTVEKDESAAIVRRKEQALTGLQGRDTSLGRWIRVLDLWCAGWFWERDAPPDRALFRELCDEILHGRSALPQRLAAPLLSQAEALAARCRFLHWTLTFPEVFSNDRGEPLPHAGFDAVLGNPPWDMVRGDSGDADERHDRRRDAHHLTGFMRESGIYRVESRAHVNRYQLFLERALQLVRPGGRVGLVLPGGVATDAGAAELRRHLFARADVDSITGMDNRSGIFPIHRSVRFALLTCMTGRPTRDITCRFGVTRLEDLEAPGRPLRLTRRFLSRLSGEDDLGIPELASEADLRIVENVSARVPWLSAESGWHVRFGRELNATEDRDAFVPYSGNPSARPIVEGKQVEPFRVAIERCRLELAPDAASRLRMLGGARLAYRDVASATNRLTLIAAVVPARAVTTHTLFCLKTPLPSAEQHVLCALLNSFVANYLVRLRVNTHVTVTLVSRLPVPLLRSGHPLFDRLSTLARTVTASHAPVEKMPEYAELQALVAQLYLLTFEEFEHILATFPLVDPSVKAASLTRLADIH